VFFEILFRGVVVTATVNAVAFSHEVGESDFVFFVDVVGETFVVTASGASGFATGAVFF
jgi:hypothetical protein